jgi:hypothetical protein
MKKGVLIFAHNNSKVDYSLTAIIAGGLAKKNLGVPVSLATDQWTLEWMKESGTFEKANVVFENIILVDGPNEDNNRKLHDGADSAIVPFRNGNRPKAWDVTPYERTLLIDSDFLIFTDHLNNYWDVDEDVMIGKSVNDLCDQDRLGYHDRYVSDTGVHLWWATTVMFTKNEKSKSFFSLIDSIKDSYDSYGDLYRFDARQYRNDISFSIANHIFSGFATDMNSQLPQLLTASDKDVLYKVDADGKLTFLLMQPAGFIAAAIKDMDIHIMNKQSIVRNATALLELI